MPTAPPDLAKRLIFAWFAYGLDPDVEHPLRPSDPHVVCRKCWRPKPPEAFHNARNASERSHCCKECHRALHDKPQQEKRRAVAAAKRASRLRTCCRCGGRAPAEIINAIRRCCPECVAAIARIRAERAAFRAAHSGRAPSTTLEYRRRQREREGAEAGRELAGYVPQQERQRRARQRTLGRWTEREADRIRAQFFGFLIEAYNRIAFATPEVAETIREAHAAEQREWYARHRQQEVARHLNWKAVNPERVSEYGRTRLGREREGADGTATREAIAELKRAATHCAYCGSRLLRKQTDHMNPVGLGGEHSLRNIVIVCPDCNARKATLSYEKWIERVDQQHRARVAALYVERYGQMAA